MSSKTQIVDEVLRRRAQECFACEDALHVDDDERQHRFRLACKRLRFAIELFEIPELAQTAEALSQITDELGASHDCAVLAKRARKCDAGRVAVRALAERPPAIARAAAIWRRIKPQVQERIR
ncbi:MAG TPA: CHAD domain-containing protein [Candidatus Baltobacteraceae bacterium]|nr:CHAD domain-containing protein [Candidatus Baltobacteraceae bacterium]